MTIAQWVIDIKATIGDRYLITGIRPRYEYSDGKRTDKVIGFVYSCVCQAKNYEAIAVFVPGACAIDDETLARNALIRFDGLQARAYVGSDGKPALAISAAAVVAAKA